MGNLKEIKNRIASVQSISKITKAMKMVASSKIPKAQALFKAREPYTKQLVSIMKKIDAVASEISHPLMTDCREHKRIGVLVISSDKGLCGSYNTNIMKLVSKFQDEILEKGCEPVYYIIGTKARNALSRGKWGFHDFSSDPKEAPDNADDMADVIYSRLVSDFASEVFDVLYIIYALAKSKSSYEPHRAKLLPFNPYDDAEDASDSDSSDDAGDIIFEPSAELALSLLLPMALKQKIATAILSAKYAEYGARIVAMTNATDNAEKLVDELRLSFFRARQDAITTEILEVSAAAAQLESKD